MVAFKPMLSATYTEGEYMHFPIIMSPKIDGIRAMVQGGKLVTRKLKLVPNICLQEKWGKPEYEGLDGEICIGNPWDPGLFNKTQHYVMSQYAEIPADGNWWLFDKYGPAGFKDRYNGLLRQYEARKWYYTTNNLRVIKHLSCVTPEHLRDYELECVTKGYEGIMTRDPRGLYKQGRSTLREAGLIKIKRFEDDEATIVRVFEQMENTNEQTTNELGRSKRSSHKAGMVGKETLGGFTCLSPNFPAIFNVGTGLGLSQGLRQELWNKRDSLVGQVIKFKYQKVGMKDSPRMPIWLGFRNEGE